MTTLCSPPPTPSTLAGAASGETVHIVTWRLFDYRGEALTYGGLQRWLLGLVDLLRGLGHPVCIHQKASTAFVRELSPGATVRGHRTPLGAVATPWFNYLVHRQIPAAAPVIYMADDVSFPLCRARSLLIQHGVWWDGEFGACKLRAAEHMVKQAVRQCAGVVCVDSNFINWYRARWPRAGHDHKFHLVPNCLDLKRFGAPPEHPAAAGGDGTPLTICFPRRSEPRRGVLLMAEVAPSILRRYPEVEFRFVVGSGYYTEVLRQRLQDADCDPARYRIEVLPFDSMREAYQDSAIVAIPTICGEGTSLSAIEAMYFGCAIVSSWVGGLCDLIQDQHNGLLIRPAVADLEASLCRLIEDPALRLRLGQRAMQDVLPRFAPERWQQQIGAVLQSTLGLGVTR